MKGCCPGCGHYRELEHGKCRECNHPPKAKRKATPLRFLKRRKSGQWDVFTEIWAERPHRCIHCKIWLGDIMQADFFAHIKSKGGMWAHLKLEKTNIMLHCPECHRVYDAEPEENYKKRKNLHA